MRCACRSYGACGLLYITLGSINMALLTELFVRTWRFGGRIPVSIPPHTNWFGESPAVQQIVR